MQAFRCIVFYIGYYGWGDFKTRSHGFQESDVFEGFSLAVAVIPYWLRFVQVCLCNKLSFFLDIASFLFLLSAFKFSDLILQCLRRLLEDRSSMHAFNGLKYFSTIVAVVTRTGHEQRWGPIWQIMAAASSGVATIVNTYWDIVIDWGLLRRNSKNPWLREKLLVPNKNVYFVAIVSITTVVAKEKQIL